MCDWALEFGNTWLCSECGTRQYALRSELVGTLNGQPYCTKQEKQKADDLKPCPKCDVRPEVGRTCSGVVTWVACPVCEAEADDIEDWNAGRIDYLDDK